MSVVTGVMLLIGASDWGEEPIAEVQAWLAENWRGQQLKDVSDGAGGGKHPQFEAWSAGINFFDEAAFANFVMSRNWYGPENVVLILQPEDGETKVYRPREHAVLSLAEGEEATRPMKAVGPGLPFPKSWAVSRT